MSELIPTLPPFSYHYLCPKCMFMRSVPSVGQAGPASLTRICAGRFYSGRPRTEEEREAGPDKECPFGASEHLHLRCGSCGHESAMNTAEVTGMAAPPATIAEIGGPQG